MCPPQPTAVGHPELSAVLYSVTANIDSETARDRYVRWLQDGHVHAVLRGGAGEARIVESVVENPNSARSFRITTEYVFPSRGQYDRYIAGVAPALRAEGLQLFGQGSGVRFERSLGTILTSIRATSPLPHPA